MRDTDERETRAVDLEPVMIYLCQCGPIIKERVDFEALERALRESPGIVGVKTYPTLCSEDGRGWLERDLRGWQGRPWVLAGCSPREHQSTFMEVCRRAGANPYLMTIANIREQCSYVTPDRREATAKAAVLVRAAAARSRWQEPLEEREIECNSDAVVIGAGPAGLSAARLLAKAGRRVTIVERTPAIGGKVTLVSELSPNMECASCMLEPLMDEILHHYPNIELLTNSEVQEVLGYLGNFTVRILKRARHVNLEGCYGCRTCHEACPVEVPSEYDNGLSMRKAIHIPYTGALPNASLIDERSCRHFTGGDCDACVAACPFGNIDLGEQDEIIERAAGAVVIATGMDELVSADEGSAFLLPGVYSALAFERLLNSAGPTAGEVRLRDGSVPRSIVLVSSTDETGRGPGPHPSSLGFINMAKYAHLLRAKLPEAQVRLVTWMRSPDDAGAARLVEEIAEHLGADFIELGPKDTLAVASASGGDELRVTWSQGGECAEIEADLVVLAPPWRGAQGVEALAGLLRLDVKAGGFVSGEHPMLRSFATPVEGVLVGGSAQGPRDVEGAVSHAAAAAGAVLATLVPGRKLTVDPARSHVNESLCGGCQVCLTVCPYKAVTFDAEKRCAQVNELLCRGCGSCVAACPSGALRARHFTDEQIEAEIRSFARLA